MRVGRVQRSRRPHHARPARRDAHLVRDEVRGHRPHEARLAAVAPDLRAGRAERGAAAEQGGDGARGDDRRGGGEGDVPPEMLRSETDERARVALRGGHGVRVDESRAPAPADDRGEADEAPERGDGGSPEAREGSRGRVEVERQEGRRGAHEKRGEERDEERGGGPVGGPRRRARGLARLLDREEVRVAPAEPARRAKGGTRRTGAWWSGGPPRVVALKRRWCRVARRAPGWARTTAARTRRARGTSPGKRAGARERTSRGPADPPPGPGAREARARE